ncbi:MAG: type III pantothenate kinase [Candidatus Omnitrophica bacterium]|nr:type III pantothenate kinase [Candidatus Omnitrophota bacterium]
MAQPLSLNMVKKRPQSASVNAVPEKWLLLDIGNTALTFQALEGCQYSDIFTVLHNDIPKKISKIASSGLIDSNTNIVIVSVVPKISDFLKKTFKKTPANQILIAEENLPVKFKHKYNDYNRLGNDRKVNIAGAIQQLGGPCLILDFGTALTVDYVSAKNVFEGGFIIPGPQTAFQALGKKTALLPKNLQFPVKMGGFLGQNTSKCMQNGILMGYSAMSSGLIQQFRQRYGKRIKIIATGGFAESLLPLSPGFDRVDPSHTLRSLAFLALAHTAPR